MRKDIFTGKVTSINHEKNYVSVAYVHNDRKKTITCRMSEKEADVETHEKVKHVYRVGDEVSFQVKGVNRGAGMIAYNLKFLYNNELQHLLDKAATDNRFVGYLKKTDNAWFIKERASYIFFPLELSKWERHPSEEHFNEAVEFRLLHTDKPGRISAELFTHDYIPEFRKAIQAFKNNMPVEAVVTRISPYAVYVDMYGGNLQSKLPLTKGQVSDLKEGDRLQVRFTYLGNTRVVIESV
ncbi:MAG: S1 RNA-binding domain-containing protein [Agriterribacter sp.]